MQRIFKFFLIALIAFLLPVSVVSGQEKRSEQKVKIVIDDGSGEKVIIDTLIKDSQKSDSIILKNGQVVILKHCSEENDLVHHNGNKKVYVTVTSDDQNGENIVKVIKIISPDSLNHIEVGGHSTMHVVKHTSAPEGDEKVTESLSAGKHSYTIKTDSRDADYEKTKYVIMKDGIMISVEGDDYEKVKELIQVIENTLDINTDGSNSKESKEKDVVKNNKKK